jgi:fibronectin-binding autotransporter adhesin
MTYALTIAVKLLPADTVLASTLLAKIYDSARSLQTTTVAGVGWTETGGGEYIFVYSSFADNLLGSIDFYNGAVFQTSTAFQPPDANVISVNEAATAANNIQAIYDGVSAGAPAKFTTLITTGDTTLNALTVSGATTLNGLTNNTTTTLTGNVMVSGTTTLSGAVSLGSTLGVTGTTTLAALGTGAITMNSLAVTNNASVGGTTTLTGNVSLGGTLGITGLTTLNALAVTNATNLNTLATSGTTTLNALTVSNATTLSGAVSLGSTLGVSGTTTLTGTVSLGNNLSVTGTTTFTDTVTVAKQLSIGGATSPAAGAFYITNASGPGMYVTTTNATSSAIEALGNTTGAGMKLTGGASSGKGMYIVGGSTDGHGLYVEGAGTGYDFVLKNDRFRDSAGGYIDVTAAAITGSVDVISISGSTSAADNLELMTKTGPSAGAALHLTTLDATGAVLFGSTFGVTGTTTLSTLEVGATTLNALTVTNNALVSGNLSVSGTTTHSGAVSFGNTFGVTGATTLNALTVSNATSLNTLTTSGTTTLNALTVSNATTLNTLSTSGAVSFGTVFNIGGMAIESLVSDQVWDELIAGHAIVVGSTAEKLNTAGAGGAGDIVSIAGDTSAATNLKNALQGDSQNVATKGTDLDNLKTVKDTITGQISDNTIMSIDQLKNLLGA